MALQCHKDTAVSLLTCVMGYGTRVPFLHPNAIVVNSRMPKKTLTQSAGAVAVGRSRQKLRTRRLLIETAVQLIAAGGQPSVTEVADAAGVSRRTAYRYFPTREKLHAEAALNGLRPVMDAAIAAAPPSARGTADVESRVEVLVSNMQRLAIENETLLRTMIHQTVLKPRADREPSRGTRRLEWIETALGPLRPKLTAVAYERLVNAVALCTGIEALLVLRDVCGLSADESVKVSQWMARVVLQASLSERGTSRRK